VRCCSLSTKAFSVESSARILNALFKEQFAILMCWVGVLVPTTCWRGVFGVGFSQKRDAGRADGSPLLGELCAFAYQILYFY
jgi:predicted membrane protein